MAAAAAAANTGCNPSDALTIAACRSTNGLMNGSVVTVSTEPCRCGHQLNRQ